MIEVQRGDVGGRPPAPFISQEKMKSLLLQLLMATMYICSAQVHF